MMRHNKTANSKKPTIHIILLLVVVLFAGAFLYYASGTLVRVRNGNVLVESTTRYERVDGDTGSILVLGDSLGYGVGTSSPETSFAGMVASRLPGYSVTNKSVVGDTTNDLALSIDQLLTDSYTNVFIMIGGNDILRLSADLTASSHNIHDIIDYAANYADNVYLITTPDFTNVAFVPWFTHPLYSSRSHTIHTAAISATNRYVNAHYVDVYDIAHTYDYTTMQASDGFHLNDAGIAALVDILFSEYYLPITTTPSG